MNEKKGIRKVIEGVCDIFSRYSRENHCHNA